MTAYSITVTNRVAAFGGGPSDTWGSYNWNAFIWGDGTADLSTRVVKLIANAMTISPTSTVGGFSVFHLIANSLAPLSETTSEKLQDSRGYFYVFPDRVTEAETRAFPTWNQQTSSTVTWATALGASTTWS